MISTRLLVIGKQGQMAQALALQAAQYTDIRFSCLGRETLDISDRAATLDAIGSDSPHLVINTAAYTAVDRSESEPDQAFAVNEVGAANVASACAALGISLIHVSTDYVYDGTKATPYVEGDQETPLGVYGKSKLAGEIAVKAAHQDAIILRTAWVYSAFGNNFLKTMLRLGAERPEIGVVADQFGNPTSAHDFAAVLLRNIPRMLDGTGRGEIFHLAGHGATTWHGFAAHIFEVAAERGLKVPNLRAISTAEYPTPANRPANSRLDCSKFADVFHDSLPDWQTSVGPAIELLVPHAP